MRAHDVDARALDKHRYIRGTIASAQGTDTITIENSAGLPFSSLEIVGKTTQPIVNQFEEYKSYFENIDNYTSGGVSGVHAILLPENWQGKELTYLAKETASMQGVELYLSDGEGYLFSNTVPLLDKDGTVTKQTTSAYTHLILTGIYPEDIEDETGNILSVPTGITEFWQGHSLSVTSVLCPDFPASIQNANSEGSRVVLHGSDLLNKEEFYQEIEIPTSVEVDGESVELNMASISLTDTYGTYTATDYLTVNRLSNKVLYHQNVGKRVLTSDMSWSEYTYNGQLLFNMRESIGARKTYNPVLTNKYLGYRTVGFVLKQDCGITTDAQFWGLDHRLTLRDARFDNLADFKADLEQNPIEIEYGLTEEITYDITSTNLGQALLSLCVPRGQNGELSVGSSVGISAVNASYYSKEAEDEVVLTVSYQNESGDSLKDESTHSVRCGSRYQIVAPHIDGYERANSEACGVAEADTKIELIYKKA